MSEELGQAARQAARQVWMNLDLEDICYKYDEAQFAEQREHFNIDAEIAALNACGAKVLAITGTDGKSTTTHLVHDILKSKHACAIRSTLEKTSHARPEFAVIEMTSDTLRLGVYDGLCASVAAFTGLTPDHLINFGTVENYFQAKRRMFFPPIAGPDTKFVINVDNPFGARLARELTESNLFDMVAFSADRAGTDMRQSLSGTVRLGEECARVETLLPDTEFNRENLKMALSVARAASGMPLEEMAVALKDARPPDGRMRRIENTPFNVVVDFAHTPDALERVLFEAKKVFKKVVLVFGVSGHRGLNKMQAMGVVAAMNADTVIVTSDSPFDVNPQYLVDQVRLGVMDGLLETQFGRATVCIPIVDRKVAIEAAIAMADADTVVLITGKGHERTQRTAAGTVPFADADVAAAACDREAALRASRIC